MNKNSFPLLDPQELAALDDALYYLKIAELKKACQQLNLPDKGKKAELITRILSFVQTGDILESPIIPIESRSKNYPAQPLAPTALMLYGSYKNDIKTRTFFKKLIGQHFHFTAFGIDWLNDRWLHGNPPTYQEFAHYWQTENQKRRQIKQQPKDEWMFIRFMQHRENTQPDVDKKDVLQAWKQVQHQHVEDAFRLLKKALIKFCS